MEILRGEISSELCRELRSLGATEVLDVQAGLNNANVKVGSLDDGKKTTKTSCYVCLKLVCSWGNGTKIGHPQMKVHEC